MKELHESKSVASAIKRLEHLELTQAFDAVNRHSRPTKQQQEILDDLADIEVNGEATPRVQYRYVIAGNQSGKSSLAARELAWMATDSHPTWKRPERWGTEPLLFIVAGQDRKNMEIELWNKKIKPFLTASDWKESRVAGVLNYVTHRKTGYQIVFVSHNDSSEANRAHLQGYVAHWVWLDEFPRDIKILEELQRRVDSRRGYMIATFTPKVRNDAIRKVIDAVRLPTGKRYRISKLDNPLFALQKDLELEKLKGYSESYRNTILYGDWHVGDEAVYYFDWDTMVVSEVPGYSPGWRHTLSVDPAQKSKFGLTVWAEDPGTGVWYLMRDNYIENIYSPDAILAKVQEYSKGYNIVKRISDPAAAWFIEHARTYRLNFQAPYNKTGRKQDLIKGLQHALSSGKIKIGSWNDNFIDEIQSCQWAENSERIVNSSIYHTMDAAQYFVDMIPPYDEDNRLMPHYQELRIKNEQRKKIERQKEKAAAAGSRVRAINSWNRQHFRVR